MACTWTALSLSQSFHQSCNINMLIEVSNIEATAVLGKTRLPHNRQPPGFFTTRASRQGLWSVMVKDTMKQQPSRVSGRSPTSWTTSCTNCKSAGSQFDLQFVGCLKDLIRTCRYCKISFYCVALPTLNSKSCTRFVKKKMWQDLKFLKPSFPHV